MKSDLSPTLQRILRDTREEISADRARTSLKRIKQMERETPPVLSFRGALAGGNALIAEIKEKSPSQGAMKPQNVEDAVHAYKKSRVVKAISVLTSWKNFGHGMRVERMKAVKETALKPVLRKDFIIEEYQVRQARAFGADAILLMANILEADEMRQLSDLAFELGMDVLFETHQPSELDDLPKTAEIIGINSRNFDGGMSFGLSKLARKFGWKRDRSTDMGRFQFVGKLPQKALKIAESGVTAKNCNEIFAQGFHAILVGTSLLTDERGITAALGDFEAAIRDLDQKSSRAATPVPAIPS